MKFRYGKKCNCGRAVTCNTFDCPDAKYDKSIYPDGYKPPTPKPESQLSEGGEEPEYGGKVVTVLDLVEEKRKLQARIMELTECLGELVNDYERLCKRTSKFYELNGIPYQEPESITKAKSLINK